MLNNFDIVIKTLEFLIWTPLYHYCSFDLSYRMHPKYKFCLIYDKIKRCSIYVTSQLWENARMQYHFHSLAHYRLTGCVQRIKEMIIYFLEDRIPKTTVFSPLRGIKNKNSLTVRGTEYIRRFLRTGSA